MDYDAIVANRVIRELDAAIAYTARHTGTPARVNGLAQAYKQAIASLEKSPLMYPIEQLVSKSAGFEVRRVRVGNYRLIFTVNEDAHEVNVTSLLHMRSDSEARFRRDYGDS